jgi:putative FmdB family regulatory protein
MPTYEYVCKSCGHIFEIVQSMKDDPLTECPECGGELRKVFAPPAISFKGSGFYATDHGKKSKQSASSKKESSDPGSSSDGESRSGDPGSGGDSKSDKPAEKPSEKPSERKAESKPVSSGSGGSSGSEGSS